MLQQREKHQNLWALCTAACAPASAAGTHCKASPGGQVIILQDYGVTCSRESLRSQVL